MATAPPAPPPAPMPQGNPYDFIINPQNKGGRGFGSMKQRLMIVALGGGVLLVMIIVFIALIGGGGGNSTNLVSLAAQQNEIARIAAIGVEKSVSSNTKNLAITAQITIESSKQDTIALLQKSGKKIGDKQLTSSQNSEIDAQLSSAAAGGSFDATFNKILADKLTTYRANLQTYLGTATSNQALVIQDSLNTAIVLSDSKT